MSLSRTSSKSKLAGAASRTSVKSKAGKREVEEVTAQPQSSGAHSGSPSLHSTNKMSKLPSESMNQLVNLLQDEVTELEVPQLSWRILSESDIKELAAMPLEEVARKLAATLSLQCHEESLQEATQLDYFVAGYWFAREHNFTEEQTSAFFTLLHELLDNLKLKQLPLSRNLKELQRLMVGVAVSRETALRCFSKEQAVLAVEYISTSLFQHYRLFNYLFTEKQEEEQIHNKVCVCLPPDPASLSPPPLEEAVTLDLYERCIAPLPPQTELKEEGTEFSGSAKGIEEGVQLVNVSPDEVKRLMETMATATLTSYQAQVSRKLKEKEDAILNKVSRLEKTLS